MKVTLDTNVLISGTFWTGDSFWILKLIDEGGIKCVLSKQILNEYFRIAGSGEIVEKVESKGLIILKTVEKVIRKSVIVAPIEKLDIVKADADDNKIVECAVSGGADFIITQDQHLLELKEFRGIRIVTPRDFLDFHKKK